MLTTSIQKSNILFFDDVWKCSKFLESNRNFGQELPKSWQTKNTLQFALDFSQEHTFVTPNVI